MPIITFFQDIFAATKGPYHRKVGRHTQNYCRSAVKAAKNESQKKLFFVAAICADELIASLMGVDNKRQVEAFKARSLKNVNGKQVAAALRLYLSSILVLTSPHKDLILAGTGFTEQNLLHAWCAVFQYQSPDMQYFDEVLLPAYRQDGSKQLSITAGKAILEQLFATESELTPAEQNTLEAIMVEDAAAVVRQFIKKTEAL